MTMLACTGKSFVTLFFIFVIILACQVHVQCKVDSYFYIYDWPKELDDVWPPPGATLHNKSGYR